MSTPELVDTSTDLGALAAAKLGKEQIVWLTTVGADGTPQPNPVWFQWRDGEVLIFTEPTTAKIRNIGRNPRVSLHFNSTEDGGEVVVLTGTARVATERPDDAEIATFTEKYTEGLASIPLTAEKFYADYSAAVRIVPDRLRGF